MMIENYLNFVRIFPNQKNRCWMSLALVPFLVVGQVQFNYVYVNVRKIIINAQRILTKTLSLTCLHCEVKCSLFLADYIPIHVMVKNQPGR